MDDDAILQLAATGGLTTERTQRALRVSRATAARRLQTLVKSGRLQRTGAGRATEYVLAKQRFRWRRAGLDEHTAWKQVEPALRSIAKLGEGEINTVNYAVTEMINNAIDHSDGTWVHVELWREKEELEIDIVDDGIGVFENVQRGHKLESLEDAVVQLEKGKLTTQPERHSGQGLFFTSKAVKRFRLISGSLAWIVENDGVGRLAREQATERLPKPVKGTRVELRFEVGHIPELTSVFAGWAEAGGEFDTTRTTVKLAQRGKALISRSEAKRVVSGLDKFKHVILDFADVDVVGQGFVDEVFRVFADSHPSIELWPANMNPSVTFMVRRTMAVDSQSLPAEGLDRVIQFAGEREPRRFLLAIERTLGIRDSMDIAEVAFRCVTAICGVFLRDVLAEETLPWDAVFALDAADVLERVRAKTPSLLRLSETELEAHDVEVVEHLAKEVLRRIGERGEVWRYFSDDDGIAAFWRLDPLQRTRVWGPTVDVTGINASRSWP